MSERELTIHRNLVSSTDPPKRRKTEYELRRMSHEQRLWYEIQNPKTEAEREQEFLREGAVLAGDETYTGDYHDDGPEPDDKDHWK